MTKDIGIQLKVVQSCNIRAHIPPPSRIQAPLVGRLTIQLEPSELLWLCANLTGPGSSTECVYVEEEQKEGDSIVEIRVGRRKVGLWSRQEEL